MDDDRTDNEKKTGRKLNGKKGFDAFVVRQQLSPDAAQRYDTYLKDHKKRLRQLEKLAAGEMSPSSQSYL